MPFVKGHPDYLTPEIRRTMNRSYITTPEHREKKRAIALENDYGSWMKGKRDSEETRKKKSDAQRGHKRGGWKLSQETRKRMSEARKGDKSPLWRGGVSSKNAIIRTTLPYKLWREAVFKRDDFGCQCCGARGVKIQADHIKPFALFPELRFDVVNGRTLCIPCHKTTPTYLRSGRALVEATA